MALSWGPWHRVLFWWGVGSLGALMLHVGIEREHEAAGICAELFWLEFQCLGARLKHFAERRLGGRLKWLAV